MKKKFVRYLGYAMMLSPIVLAILGLIFVLYLRAGSINPLIYGTLGGCLLGMLICVGQWLVERSEK